MAVDIKKLIDIIATDPELQEIIYGNKEVICKKFSMKEPTLSKWIKEIKSDYPVQNVVINPGGLCLIHIEKFEKYLIWKHENKFK